ncbi:MAG: sigma-54-dependent transcriptional regulator [Bacteriovoracaceae bacterium]
MNRQIKILALDDDTSWLSQVPLILEDQCEVITASTIDQGIGAIQNHFFDVILLDMNFEGDPRSGLDVFRLIHAADKGADVIVISGETKPERLIQIMNAGITSFLPKPVPPQQIREAIQKVIDQRELKFRALDINQNQGDSMPLIGNSLAIRKLREEISKVVSAGVKDILLLGETGTGKEVVARSIAYLADPSKRFVPIHCGAISDNLVESELFGHVKGAFTGADRDKIGAFEAAGGGFVFLDEIGEMPSSHQTKLLRVIQERKIQKVGSHVEKDISFRTISATHVNIEDAISKKVFREDLYYRIAKAKIRIPSLRERLEDIPALVHHFINQNGKKKTTITNDAIDLLKAYHWPGNVRQLQSMIETVCNSIEGDVIREKDVCQAMPALASIYGNRTTKLLVKRFGTSLISQEKERFEKALREADGNRDHAASSLGMSRATFFRRLKELGLVKERSKNVTYSSLQTV